jgi:hypothetical protein
VLAQILATRLAHQSAQHIRRLAMGLNTVAALDPFESPTIDEDHA